MAHITTNHAPSTTPLNPLRAFGEAILKFLSNIAESNHRIREVERLNALSDAQLKSLGLRRQDIVRHVFRDVYYV
ncbi:DUF1127 domain-containing protein [Thetidibacter halocola]|uniref:DUF1127 domain-containing protein n=1 Tax=Thetidibacter halocola TaxID=2827239 RepID=A0A8J7WIP2_9RHOB|nr:DUF1127 domain-containing protein [Thetidibacter halocola]MBS0126336.1 DUF1127 domain-containing protein [Thetidibacter halocola]